MAITVKHKFVSAIPDGTDATIVRPSNWNDDHDLTGTIPVANGGTGASTLTGYVKGNGTSAMTASATIPSGDVSGLGTMATQNANAVAITGGTINGTTVGATTPAAGTFTTLTNSGTATLANGSTTYVTVTGDASYPMVKATGGTNTPLVLSPLGTGALQAQKTDSTATGGNARGANAVDWQTSRNAASQVASGTYAFLGTGYASSSTGVTAGVVTGTGCQASGFGSFVGSGNGVLASGLAASAVGGQQNTSSGYFSFVGGGMLNSTTSNSAVTTQSATMNATTAVTLSGSNANIKVGQLITGTSIASYTYVAAISGTSLTLSQAASGSSTSTLSFYTPHGVVVGGGNNQATGSYSFIGGGGDAGTAANRNVASADWSTVGGGRNNTASGMGAVVAGGGYYNGAGASNVGNTASGDGAFVGAGFSNSAQSFGASILGGNNNTANATYSVVLGTQAGTTRGIQGNIVSPASLQPLGSPQGSSQSALLVLGAATTDATATVLRSSSSAAGTTNQVILPNNSAYYFRGEVVSGVTGGGNTKGWTIEGVIKRGANAASTALVGSPMVVSSYADVGAATWALTATADTTNGGLAITFTGQAATTIRTVCQIRTTEMTY